MLTFSKLRSRIYAFKKDSKGSTAIEFAILIPILLVVLIPGSFEITNALLVKRKGNQTATVLADLATQNTTINMGSWNQMAKMVEKIMYPYDGMTTRLGLVGVEIDEDEKVSVAWSYGSLSPDPGSLPSGLIIKNSFYVLAASEVDYAPLLASSVVGNITFRDTAVLAPRVSLKVEKK